MTGKDQWVAVITGGPQGTGAGLVTGHRRLGWRWWPTPARSSRRRTRTCSPSRETSASPPPRTGSPATRWRAPAHRHPGQQRRRLRLQAVHRLHGGGLRAHGRRQPHRVLLADPARHRRDAQAERRPCRQHQRHPRRLRQLQGANGAGRTHQGGGLAAATRSLAVEYACRGIRVNAVSPGIIQTPAYPPESYEGLGDQIPRSGAPARSATS
jgi:hypothetical protein